MEDTQSSEQPTIAPTGSNKKPSKKVVILVLVILALIVAGVGIVMQFKSDEKKPTTSKTDTSATPAALIEPAEVSISKDGFLPATIKVRKGQSVNWTNQDDAIHQIAADPHPSHSSLPELLGDPLSKGESYSFTFEKSGTFTYHDELNPTKFSGVVIVE